MKNLYKEAMERFSSLTNENRHFCESQARTFSKKGMSRWPLGPKRKP